MRKVDYQPQRLREHYLDGAESLVGWRSQMLSHNPDYSR
jgi:hypothetical protein